MLNDAESGNHLPVCQETSLMQTVQLPGEYCGLTML
jgi:hypothetical protein